MEHRSRRSVLGISATVVAGLAGCLGSAEPPGLVVRNRLDRPVSYTVEIIRQSDGNAVFSRDGSLAVSEAVSFADPVSGPGRYTLRAMADGRAQSYEWTFSANGGVEVTFEPGGWSFTETGG